MLRAQKCGCGEIQHGRFCCDGHECERLCVDGQPSAAQSARGIERGYWWDDGATGRKVLLAQSCSLLVAIRSRTVPVAV